MRVFTQLVRRPAGAELPSDDIPIFVHGMSRSGGTLVTTLLDAHPDVAMSYELYPQLLEGADVAELAKLFSGASSIRNVTKKLDPNLKTFFLRVERSGLEAGDVADVLRIHRSRSGLETARGRVELVARLARAKMLKLGKTRWGVKCGIDFGPYRDRWPDARFVGLMRDGRDVLASQQNTGAFNRDPARIASAWINDVEVFDTLLAEPGAHALRVRYEELVADPEPQIRRMAEFAGVGFDPRMLRHNEQELTVFDSHHLSMDRITKPIDASQVARWRRDVSPEDLEVFLELARGTLQAAGYPVG